MRSWWAGTGRRLLAVVLLASGLSAPVLARPAPAAAACAPGALSAAELDVAFA